MRLVFSADLWSMLYPEEVYDNASEGMDMPAITSRQEQELLPCPLFRWPPEGVAQMKDKPSHFKRSR